MSKPALQQRLAQHSGLLASQHQLLQRLLLQLEFNQPDRLQLVGGSGSGKSTLILTLAEICSEQFNVALLQADSGLAPVDILKVLQQQWFGSSVMPRSLPDFVAQLKASEQYLLLVDDADQLTDASWQVIQQLPVSVFVSSLKAMTGIRLALNIPVFTEEEATALLITHKIQGRELHERIEDSAGDLHLLLRGLNASSRNTASLVKSELQVVTGAMTFSAKEQVEPPVFVSNSAAQSDFDLNENAAFVNFRAIDSSEQQPTFQIETEQRSDYQSRSMEKQRAVKQAPGQFFSPFLVMSLGFGLIAAVVMFWLWTEQQFRQPIAEDMAPFYPASIENSSDARLQQERRFEPTVKIQQETLTDAGSTQAQQVASAKGMPQMALDKETAAMTVHQEVAKDDNGLPQKKIVSMTIESEPMREQPVIPALPAAGAEAPQPEQQNAAQPAVSVNQHDSSAEPDQLLEEMAADSVKQSPGPNQGTAKFDEAVLLGMLPDTVAIQLGVFSQEAAARKFLQQYSALNLHLYQRQLQGKTQYVVVSASYINGAAARQQVKSLPEELRQQTPFVKQLGDIQQEIRLVNTN